MNKHCNHGTRSYQQTGRSTGGVSNDSNWLTPFSTRNAMAKPQVAQLGNQLRKHQECHCDALVAGKNWMFLERAPLGQLLSPSPTVKNRFSSISLGTSTFLGLLNFVVKAVAVAVSLYAGRDGKTGLVLTQLEEQEDVLYSRMAVVVYEIWYL
ncbi:hypothetical protein H5410_028935 [Solanum commersonii]|uniref:Uncharacterized protein n=1 Tax=Solanum commersonii TaxID=4109 RepID=A0A9J5Z3B0_SOLCO|nr:hypothetical protein H5410_028935 [Solanum commersonii]